MIRFMALTAVMAGWAAAAQGAVAVTDRERLWLDHVVPYAICEQAEDGLRGCAHGGRPLAGAEADKVREAVAEWNALFAGALYFEERSAVPRDRRGVLFSRSSQESVCSTDQIGRPKSERRTDVEIGTRCNRFASAQTPVGTVLHEMMHVAGFYHEQQRPDRETFLRSRVPSGLVNVLFDIGGATQWARSGRKSVQMLGPYDFGSIMHYPVRDGTKAELTPEGLARLEEQGLERSDPGRRDAMSPEDVAGVLALYGTRPAAEAFAGMSPPREP